MKPPDYPYATAYYLVEHRDAANNLVRDEVQDSLKAALDTANLWHDELMKRGDLHYAVLAIEVLDHLPTGYRERRNIAVRTRRGSLAVGERATKAMEAYEKKRTTKTTSAEPLTPALCKCLGSEVWQRFVIELRQGCTAEQHSFYQPLLALHRAAIDRVIGSHYGARRLTVDALIREPVAVWCLCDAVTVYGAQVAVERGSVSLAAQAEAMQKTDDEVLAGLVWLRRNGEDAKTDGSIYAYTQRFTSDHPYIAAYYRVLTTTLTPHDLDNNLYQLIACSNPTTAAQVDKAWRGKFAHLTRFGLPTTLHAAMKIKNEGDNV
jgi:hypothetical protein